MSDSTTEDRIDEIENMKHESPRTLSDVAVRIGLIHELAEYPRLAHSQEDELHRDVLDAIAKGIAEDPPGMAALARSTWDKFGFSRWYD